MENRILLLALRGRDADVISGLLARQAHASLVCASALVLAEELGHGAATAIITEESLTGADRQPLDRWLADQKTWSDFPFILLATKRAGPRSREAFHALEGLGNVVVLERPIHSETLSRAVVSALRVRARQYEARARLVALETAEEGLRQSNALLEGRVAERTEALSLANNKLMQEVAERERAQAALVQSQKMEAVGQLTGGIAHDFNNLLTVISGNLELIERRAGDDRIARNAGFARNATERAAKLTHQLLAFSRTQQLTLAPLSLNDLVEGMKDLLDRTIGPQIRKTPVLDPDTPWVMADSHQLELAVLNLAINARDAMPSGGHLTIRTGIAETAPEGMAAGQYGVIDVQDSGTGIPKHILPKVFDPFFTTKPVGKGTGLGLSQVFGIAQQSGGVVQVESVQGEGTTVTIFLPLVDAPVPLESAQQNGAPVAEPVCGNILVIDDDDGVRAFIVECLEALGYTVAEASSGEEGLLAIAGEAPDLLIVDFAMSGLSGSEVARRARGMVPALPVILATGYAEMEPDEDPNLFKAVLRKPFHIDTLAQAARTALELV